MNLLDLSEVCIGSMKECIEREVNFSEVGLYMVVDDTCHPVNRVQLLFGDVVKESGILILDNVE